MHNRAKNLIRILLLIPVVAGLCSCSDWIYEYPPENAADEDRGISLLMHVSTVNGGTRSLISESFEKIRTLRIVLLDEAGVVEANRYWSDVSDYDFTARDGGGHDFVITRLTPGKKTLYLIANEEGVHGVRYNDNGTTLSADCLGDLLDEAGKGDSGFAQKIESVWFDGFYPSRGNMPYSVKYEVTLGAGSENYRSFYLVPAATKFTFNFWNYREKDVTVNSVKLASVADRSWLLGHVGASDMYKDYTFGSESASGVYWVDWLARVARESWATDGDYEGNVNFNDTHGWIFDYSVPATAAHSPVTLDGLPVLSHIDEDSTVPSHTELLYLSESFNGNPQAYQLIFDIMGGEYVNGIPKEMPNVKALFRDTHVKINVRFRDTEFTLDDVTIDVDPWDEDELNPEFGLRVWTGGTDVDPWDEDELNPELGHGHGGFSDGDPWDESDQNPGYGGGNSGSTDNDPWDESGQNPDYGGGNSGTTDGDPWDENDQNPGYGGGNSGTTDVDPWDESGQNPGYGGGNSGATDGDPWDENDQNPGYGGGNSGTTDGDPWDESGQNPNFGESNNGGVTDNDPWDEGFLNPGFHIKKK